MLMAKAAPSRATKPATKPAETPGRAEGAATVDVEFWGGMVRGGGITRQRVLPSA